MTNTKTKIRGIVFSEPEIGALLSGIKTQMRQIITTPRKIKNVDYGIFRSSGKIFAIGDHSRLSAYEDPETWSIELKPSLSIGDVFYAKETWAKTRYSYLYAESCVYSDGPQGNTDDWDWPLGEPNRWRSPVHMPKQAARIWRKVKNVQSQKLHDISEADAIAEGFARPKETHHGTCIAEFDPHAPWSQFRSRWNKLHADGLDWNSNPWVWVYNFEPCAAIL